MPIIRKSQGEGPRRGERIMTIGLRKDRLKNEPTTGNIRCGIIPHLIFRTAVGLANDMEGIISCTATARVGEGRSVIPQPGRSSRRSHCRRSWATGRKAFGRFTLEVEPRRIVFREPLMLPGNAWPWRTCQE